jgi:hypothetical protein
MKARITQLAVLSGSTPAGLEAAWREWRSNAGEAEVVARDFSTNGNTLYVAIWFTGSSAG